MNISLIIPCYNEEAAIGKLVKSVPSSVGEILVIDNNSSDRSAEVARSAGAKVVHESKQGYGAAIRRGFKEATGDILIVLDADGQYPIEKINEAVAYLKQNNLDFVSCNRFPLEDKTSLPLVRRFGNHLFTVFTNILFGISLKDSQSGMWVFKKEILDKIDLESYDMPLSQEIKIRALKNASIKFGEFHIPYAERVGESKLVPLKHGFKNLFFLLRLRIQLWRTIKEEKKRFAFGIGVLAILALYVFLSFLHIRDPFIHVTADVNGGNALAAENWATHGMWAMKFGHHGDLLKQAPAPSFYTHHPNFFLLPTASIYKLFGVSEMTTRLGPLLYMVFALAFFAFALRALSRSHIFPLFTLLVFVLFPGVIFYAQTFELAVFSIPAALFTFSFFIFYRETNLKMYKWLFLLSIIIGGMMSWFYYFMPASIWLYVLLAREYRTWQDRKQLLVIMPLLLFGLFVLNILHFYWLGGSTIFEGLESSFKTRAGRLSLFGWSVRIVKFLDFHITPLYGAAALLGTGVAGIWYRKQQLVRTASLFFVMLIGVIVVFMQWMTHPFGVIFFWVPVALATGYLLATVVEKWKYVGLVCVILFFAAGGFATNKGMNYFYNDFRILHEIDVKLFQELSPMVEDYEVCLGADSRGIGIHGIVQFYMRKSILSSCADERARVALVWNPRVGNEYKEYASSLEAKGFVSQGCAGYICLLEKSQE